MRKYMTGAMIVACAFLLMGCNKKSETASVEDAVQIELFDAGITVNGEPVSESESDAVYIARDIVYYPEGKDFTFGEGTEEDAHSAEEAAGHTVVHITEPGTYTVSGMLSAGQIAIDLGEDAENNPDAVVTLVLNDVDITCTVAPAVIFYHVYECGDDDVDAATKDVDTTTAGANVVIADGTENNVSGSYVARIYESYELNEAGTEVIDSKKLHKYDAAFYSCMSMNVSGGSEGTGVLNILAENEGLDSELHLTLNGGNINITSGNDGINTNEDEVSVTTVNDGTLNIQVTGETGEGDGIDSNGWLVINGGTVTAQACSFSMDAGIDSDMGIHINGGTVMATGNMLDRISESEQNYAVFTFSDAQNGESEYILKDESGKEVLTCIPANDFSIMILASDDLQEGIYTLWQEETQLAVSQGNMMGGGMPQHMERLEMPEGGEMPEGMTPPEGMEPPAEGQMPEGMKMPPDGEMPQMEEKERPEMPQHGEGGRGGFEGNQPGETTQNIQIVDGGNYFNVLNVDK